MTPGEREQSVDSNAHDMLRLQREANEALVLHAIQAAEDADGAHRAQRVAERETSDLREREAALRVTAEFRERLIGIIGHDLRTPLNALLIAGDTLIVRGRLDRDDALLAQRIIASGERMARMITQLADFTRVRLGGDFELKLAPTDLQKVCQEIAEELRMGASADVQLTCDGTLVGAWDADRLAQAIANIAGNAVDHASPGTPVRIQVREDGDDTALVAISNEGPDIPEELLPVLFDAFRRGGNRAARPKPGHLGLGLYIAREVVRAHQGSIVVCSTGGMTTFTLRLPR